ncbi:MAG: fertility inhibition FinO-like protein [Gammaproteobacteria bacterium]|nr:MAG: fertility inhibition FinO-like protein [Gammaproteobacteria bacterium]RKZ44972.1 MAG: fertility inhibition FinO-like protein [Gammaproteobacteria bacterium]RKZ73213.1 MAG: fertility inhibition FinO-like protein [Gammaproteobacteria bacterium]
MPKTLGKLEVNIKINELPNWVESIKNSRQQFYINADGQIVRMKVRNKTWQKLLQANEKYPEWVASITGKMGHHIKNGFELLEPAIQVYEKNSKEANAS